jgi:hypothetical protein
VFRPSGEEAMLFFNRLGYDSIENPLGFSARSPTGGRDSVGPFRIGHALILRCHSGRPERMRAVRSYELFLQR